MGFIKKRFRSIKKWPDWLFFFPALTVKALCFLTRVRIVDPHASLDYAAENPAISVTWHNRLLLLPPSLPSCISKRVYAVVSPSRDGQYVVDLISRFNMHAIRGSSAKGAATALREAKRQLDKGKIVSFTPDGPRGPVYKMKNGPVTLSSQNGVPVFPISVNYSSCWSFKSWDGFQVPKPWARTEVNVGELVYIPENLDREGIEKWRGIIEKELNKISKVDQ